jgi:primosomal protein N' (replication factor Y)
MPFKDLGLIVMDEEHEGAYKASSQTPRYESGEVARKLGSLTGAHIVYVSATPSTETFYRAKIGELRLLSLPQRIHETPLPPVEIIDMRSELLHGNRTPISVKLASEIDETLRASRQVILFLNRRGYATYIFCRECGAVVKCENCDVSMTYHIDTSKLICHYCGSSKQVPQTCPNCNSKRVRFMGAGTEQIEEIVKQMFPKARVLRCDSDTVRAKGAYESIMDRFMAKEADILIGTQMVVKGLDYQHVALVGIILADASLNFPDLNAPQRTFQLTAQASGRAGRSGAAGKVIMQTYQPDNKTLIYSALSDYIGFYSYDIDYRRRFSYPPFSEILGLFIAHEDEKKVSNDASAIYNDIVNLANDCDGIIKLLNPAPASIQKLKGKYIFHILLVLAVKSPFKKRLRENFSALKNSVHSNVFVEMNPVTLL